jgi:hypothetical protein
LDSQGKDEETADQYPFDSEEEYDYPCDSEEEEQEKPDQAHFD